MALCDERLAMDFIFDCDNIPVAGLKDEALLINYEDVDFGATEFNVTPEGETSVKTLILKEGTHAWSVQQMKTSFDGTMWESVEGTYLNGVRHTFAFVVFDTSAAAKASMNKLLNGRFIAVVRNKRAAYDGTFEILGWETGLSIPTLSRNYVSVDTNGVTTASLASDVESQVPLTFFNTDVETTQAQWEALKVATPPAGGGV